MAVGLTNLANNVSTVGDAFSTGSLTWAAGSRGVVFLASSVAGGGSVTGHTVTGGGETWTEIGFIVYGARRGISVLVSNGTPDNGELDIAVDYVTTAYQETQWSVEQVTDFDAGTWPATATEASTASGTALNAPDVGTLDAGDIALFGAGFEAADDNLAVAAGSTQHIERTGGGNVRSLLIGYSSTDDTPGATWDTSGNSIGIQAILIKATAGAAAALSIVPIIQNYRNMRIM